VLLGAGVSALAACTPDRHPRPAAPTLEETLLSEAVSREEALVAAYLAALQERPELAGTLTHVLEDHSAHLAALHVAAGTATPTPGPSGSSAPPTRRRSRQAVLTALAALERAAADAHAHAAERAEPTTTCDRVLAPLLASLAASEASHVMFV
jgi:hypothetical protein